MSLSLAVDELLQFEILSGKTSTFRRSNFVALFWVAARASGERADSADQSEKSDERTRHLQTNVCRVTLLS